ncbi:MAG TPA: hydrogenase nickel incorporation protein HypB [Bacillota bacterium]|nr:hydrogenase nickel incorporation protein HypB [Bacillota bacterium]HOK69474.1 hydrogenase nickel incorporation protein HypB [Bacillota bacterium]HPP86082.1 hydrogenase nickel incorporation protein HypB [Bacillota bacterium]
MAEIKVQKDVKSLNKEIAEKNRAEFKKHNIFVMNIMGSPGSGKTTLLENILPVLAKSYRTAVIEGDLATQNDAERIRKTGVEAFQINTNGGCHLNAKQIEAEYAKIDPDHTDLIIIENVGNLVCPIEWDLGEDLRVVLLSAPEGEDKPLKYPPAMLKTDAVVITKADIASFADVNIEQMKKNILSVNPKAVVLEAGKVNGVYSAESVIDYIKEKIKAKKAE